MAKFTLELKCDNAAFEDEPMREVGRILAELSNAMIAGLTNDGGHLRDMNGNTVGRWYYDE